MNSPDGRIKANAAIVPAGSQGAVSVYVTNTTDLILDIDGYFATPGSQTYQFFPLTPCRLVDTRGANGNLGGPRLLAQTPRDFPLLSSPCTSDRSQSAGLLAQLHGGTQSFATAAGISVGVARGGDATGSFDSEQSNGNCRGKRGHRTGREPTATSTSTPTTRLIC